MDIETILSSLEEEVRRWRGLAALECEAILRDASLQKAAALSAAILLVGRLDSLDGAGRHSIPATAIEPALTGEWIPQRFQNWTGKEIQP